MRKILLLLFPLLFGAIIINAQNQSADNNIAMQLVSASKAQIGLSDEDLKNVIVSNTYLDPSTGIRLVYLQQTYRDIPVYNQILVLAFKDNKLATQAGEFNHRLDQVVNERSGVPSVTAESAVQSALSDRGLRPTQIAIAINTKDNGRKVEFTNMGVSRENITAQLMWSPVENTDQMRLAWQVYFIPKINSDYWMVRVDAINNSILGMNNLTVYCNWDDPNHVYQFGKEHNHINDIPKSLYGGNNLFDFKTVAKAATEITSNGDNTFSPSLVDNASYRVIPLPYEAPTFMPGPFPGTAPGNSTVVNNPWTAASANATTLKWHSTDAAGTDYNYTRGNNVWAYFDRPNTNTPNVPNSSTSTTPLPTLTFIYGNAPDYTLDPVTNSDNQRFNVTNLFYYNNIIHDVLYAYGFDEPGGNFQFNNLGRGGLGNDHVLGEAQDAGGTNNANFATPADGGSGRMQMYIWTLTSPNRDGDVDNGIIAHEFGHGVSNRLFGGPSQTGCVSNGEHQGEGISDWIALMLTQNWATSNVNSGLIGRGIGTFALGQATTGLGIRSQRYSTDLAINNKVYQAVLPTAVHDRGEFWAAAAWEATWAVIQQAGTINPDIYFNGTSTAGNVVAMRLGIQAMKLAPCGSGFIDHRNGWLSADTLLYGGTYSCALWRAFAKRGMGFFASQGSPNSAGDQVPDFTPKSYVGITASAPTIPDGQNLTYTNTVTTCSGTAIAGYSLQSTLPLNVTFVSATNGGVYNGATRVITWPVNQAATSSATYQFTVTVGPGAFPGNVVMPACLYDNSATPRLFNCASVTTPITPVVAGCPTITSQPANAAVCVNTTATFTTVASSAATPAYQWQISTTGPGGPWTNLANGAPYSGVTTATLTINPATLPLNGNNYRCLVTNIDCPLGVPTNAALLNVYNASIGGTVTPANTQVCGTTNSGTLTLSGHTGSVVRWESSTVGAGGPFTPIANTTTTLNYTNLTQTTWYQAVVQVTGCAAVTSSVATVTFVPALPLSIVAVPGTTLCAGDPALLTVMEGSFSNATPSAPLGGTNGNNLVAFNVRNNNAFPMTLTSIASNSFGSGAITARVFYKNVPIAGNPGPISAANGWTQFGTGNYTVTASTLNQLMTGMTLVIPAGTTYGIALDFTGATFPRYTNGTAAVVTYSNGGCDIITGGNVGWGGPAAPGTPANNPRNFNGTVTLVGGSLTPVTTGTFLWTPATGLSSTTSNPTAASPAVTTTYTVTHNNGSGCNRQANITITVNDRPTVTSHPATSTICSGSPATFTVAGTGTGLTYQWQVSTAGVGGPWVNLANTAPYSGVNTATLTVNPTAVAMNGYAYRCVLGGTCPPAGTANISNAAVLNVNALPTVTVTPTAGCGGVAGINGLLLTASGASTYTWAPVAGLYTNATTTTPYTGGNTPTVYAAPTAFTVYTVTGTAAGTGCSSTASAQVNYTPPAPTVTPSSVTMCLGDPAVKLKSSSSQQFTTSFSSGTINLTIPDGPTIPPVPTSYPAVASNITVSGIPAGATIANVRARLNITHAWVSDLVIALRAPNGQVINLSALVNGTNNPGANFTNTVISSAGTNFLSTGAGPYTGTFRADLRGATFTALGFTWPGGPTGYVPTSTVWSSLYSTPNGVWSIGLYDAGAPDGGVFNNWSIDIDYIVGVPATPAVWTPAAGLFSDAAASIPYVAGTAVDSVWTRPTPSGVYNYQATVQSLSLPPSEIQTAFTNNNQFALVTSNFTNNNAFPVTITGIESVASTSGGSTARLYYKTSAIAGAPGAISAANGWNLAGTGTYTAIANTTTTIPQPMLSGLSLVIPAGATYGIAFESQITGGAGNLRYSTVAAGTYTNTGGGCVLTSGTNVSFAGDLAPIAPTFTPRAFIGKILFSGANAAPCTSPARNITVTVNQPVSVTTQPVNRTICTDKVATFTVAATASGTLTYQWQVSTNNGGTWTNVANGGVYSGATSATLTITAPPVSMSGYFYRCVITGAAPCPSVNSFQAILTVNPLPTVVITAPLVSLFPGLTTTISSTVSPFAAATYTWFRNGTAVSGANTGTLNVNVDGLGDYWLTVTDVNGCTNTSNTITIKDSATASCYIYPNPNSGLFQVRYHSVANNVLPRTLTVYDAKGDRVLTQRYTIGRPYDRMDVDMRRNGKGLYWVEIGDVNGNRLTMCRIVIQ